MKDKVAGNQGDIGRQKGIQARRQKTSEAGTKISKGQWAMQEVRTTDI